MTGFRSLYVKSLRAKIMLWAGGCLLLTVILIVGYAAYTMQGLVVRTEGRAAAVRLLLGIGALTSVAMGVLWITAGRIGLPIQQITAAARSVTKGNMRLIEVGTHDETSELAEAFNQMVAQLNGTLRSEQDQRAYMEMLVQQYIEYITVVGQGDLTHRLELYGDGSGGYDDPLLVLGRRLNDMTANLQLMTGQIGDAAGRLSAAADEILGATAQQVTGANQQSAAISQTTTTLNEVKVIAEQATARAQQVTEAAQRTVAVTRAGQNAVQQSIDSMQTIKERVEDIAENILALSGQMQQIGQIIVTVNDIASQSNLLALNAAVEAARAGEHGRGFAVVAAEVRSLAEQSRRATAQVKAILLEIQKAADSTVMATEEGAKGVDEGVRLVAQTQKAIEQLANAVHESAQAASQVAAGGQQQSSGMEQIAQAMRDINQVTVQNLSSTRQTEKAVQNLDELARSLAELIARYKL
jgi:methyl-accepting chemotaxis protein